MKKPADPTKSKVIIIPHPPKDQHDGAPNPAPAEGPATPADAPAEPQGKAEGAKEEGK